MRRPPLQVSLSQGYLEPGPEARVLRLPPDTPGDGRGPVVLAGASAAKLGGPGRNQDAPHLLSWCPPARGPLPQPLQHPGGQLLWGSGPLLPSPSPAQPAQPWEALQVVPSLQTAEGPGQGSRGGGGSGALVSSSVKWDCNDPAAELRDDGRGAPGEEAEVPPQARRKSCPAASSPSPQPGHQVPAWGLSRRYRPWGAPRALLCQWEAMAFPSFPFPLPRTGASLGLLHQAPEHQPPPLETSGEPHLKAKVLWGETEQSPADKAFQGLG